MEDSNNIRKLQEKILAAAFKYEIFQYPNLDSAKKNKTETIAIPTMLYVHSSNRKMPISIGCQKNIKNIRRGKNGVIIGLPTKTLIDLHDLLFKMDEFTYDVASIIWYFKQEKEPEFCDKILTKIQQSYLKPAVKFAKDQGYSKGVCDKELRNAKEHGNKMVRQLRKMEDFNYNQGKHYWIERENIAINNIQLLYKKFLPDIGIRKMVFNLAIVFDAIDFWTDIKNKANLFGIYAERLKKRIKRIKKTINRDNITGQACIYDEIS